MKRTLHLFVFNSLPFFGGEAVFTINYALAGKILLIAGSQY
jgi:hypothetical protein